MVKPRAVLPDGGKENWATNPAGSSPELRKRLVRTRAQARFAEQKHTRTLQEIKVKNLIDSAITKNECSHLKGENLRMKDKVCAVEQQLERRDQLITDLKTRIAHMSRKNGSRFRGHTMSQLASLDESSACLSMNDSLDMSREERLCSSPSPVPEEPAAALPPGPLERQLLNGQNAITSVTPSRLQAQSAPRQSEPQPLRSEQAPPRGEQAPPLRSEPFLPTQRRCWTANPQVRVVPAPGHTPEQVSKPSKSPQSQSRANTPMSEMSVEGVVDRANHQVQTLLMAGEDALLPPADNGLDDTMRTEQSELVSTLVPFGDILGASEVIPFLEKTSEDLRHAEEQVHGVYQDLEAFTKDEVIVKQLHQVKNDNEHLRTQVEDLMKDLNKKYSEQRQLLDGRCDDASSGLTTRSTSAGMSAGMSSPGIRNRSVSPPPVGNLCRRPSATPSTGALSRLAVRPSSHKPALLAPQVSQHQQLDCRRAPDGSVLVKVGETRTELWRRI
jgi:hypothetical protein